MKFDEGNLPKKVGKWCGFLLFVLIFSTVLTIVSRFTKIPDLSYITALIITFEVLLTGFILGKFLE